MNWLTAIDLYCERLDPSYWAEPLNALSNLAFPLAAIWAWTTAIKRQRLDPVLILLCIMASLIGLGSFLFHTYANLWSSFADVIPIWSFVALYIVIAVIRSSGKSPARVGTIAAGVIAIIVGIVWIMSSGSATQVDASPDLLNGSMQYAPALVALWTFAILSLWRKNPVANWIIAAAATFGLSLGARTVDMHLCSIWPFGTHFLWHILNGLMIALLLQALIRMKPNNIVHEPLQT